MSGLITDSFLVNCVYEKSVKRGTNVGGDSVPLPVEEGRRVDNLSEHFVFEQPETRNNLAL